MDNKIVMTRSGRLFLNRWNQIKIERKNVLVDIQKLVIKLGKPHEQIRDYKIYDPILFERFYHLEELNRRYQAQYLNWLLNGKHSY